MKSEAFVSAVVVFERLDNEVKDNVLSIQRELEAHYSDYEILLVIQGPARHRLPDAWLSGVLETIPSIRVIQLAFAVHPDVARAAGIENAIGDFVVLLDPAVDPLNTISAAVTVCQKGADVVIGVSSRPAPLVYKLVRRLAWRLLVALDYQIAPNATDFRCVSRRAINAVIDTGRFYHQLNLRFQKTGYPSDVVIYEPRIDVYQRRSLFAAGRSFLRLLVFNSTQPLRWMAGAGLLGSFLGFCFAIYSLAVRVLREGVVEGWTSLVLFTSVQFMLLFIILAFISEYMSRLLDEQRGGNEYAVVYEKSSTVRLKEDRVNVLSEPVAPEIQSFPPSG